MSATDRARDRLIVVVWSPLHQRQWTISDAQYSVMTAVYSGWSGSQRGLAAKVGLSLHGLERSVASLVNGGLLTKMTTRGRRGHTRLKVRDGVFVIGNVPTKVRTSLETTESTTTRSLSLLNRRNQGGYISRPTAISDILKEVAS